MLCPAQFCTTVEDTEASQTRLPGPVADEGNIVAGHAHVQDPVAVLALELNAANGRHCNGHHSDGASRVEPCVLTWRISCHGRF